MERRFQTVQKLINPPHLYFLLHPKIALKLEGEQK